MVKFAPVDQKGFSLLELLFVLSLLSIFLVLVQPLSISILEKQQEKRFLETFQADVLFVQSSALTTGELAELIFEKDRYQIQIGKKIVEERSFPPSLTTKSSNLQIITFNELGTIRKGGTITLDSNHSTYEIVFPLGKGRCYIIENA